MRLLPSLAVLLLLSSGLPSIEAAGSKPEPPPLFYGLLEDHPEGREKAAAPHPRAGEPPTGLAELLADLEGFEKVLVPNEVFGGFDKGDSSSRVLVTMLEPEKSARIAMLADPDARADVRRMVAERVNPVIAEVQVNEPGFELIQQYENFPVFAAHADLGALIALMEDPRVQIIEADGTSELQTAQGLPLINAIGPRSQYDGSGVTLAIIDAGFDYMHPALGGGAVPNGKITQGWDFIGNQPDFRMLNSTHGTAVAGVAAGLNTSSGDYIGGVAPGAKIAGLNTFPDGEPSGQDSHNMAALDWTITYQHFDPQNPILVVNMSLGSPSFMSGICNELKPAYSSALDAVFSAGMMVVAAAGNEGLCGTIGYPACVGSVIAVGAVYDANIGPAGWCVNHYSCLNSGVVCGEANPPNGIHIDQTTAAKMVTGYSNSGTALHVFAPSNDATTPLTGGGVQTTFGGTSTASPYTAGALTVLQHAAKANTGNFLTPVEAFGILTSTGEVITDWKVPSISRRLVNLQGMVAAVDNGGGSAPANDNFPGTSIQSSQGSITGTTTDATRQQGEPVHANVATNSGSVWYTWVAPTGGEFTFSTCEGASFDTVLAVYTGNNVGSLSLVAANDDAPDCDNRSRVAFNASPGATYRIAVAGYNSATGTFTLDWQSTSTASGRDIGDFTGDGCVNFADFVFLLDNWGQSAPGGAYGFADFVPLLNNWGNC